MKQGSLGWTVLLVATLLACGIVSQAWADDADGGTELAVLAFRGLKAPMLAKGQATMVLETSENLKQAGGYLQPADRGAPGVLVLRVDGEWPVGNVRVAFEALCTGMEHAVELAWATADGPFDTVARWSGDSSLSGPGWPGACEAAFTAERTAVRIRLVLTGAAKLRAEPSQPVSVRVWAARMEPCTLPELR